MIDTFFPRNVKFTLSLMGFPYIYRKKDKKDKKIKDFHMSVKCIQYSGANDLM